MLLPYPQVLLETELCLVAFISLIETFKIMCLLNHAVKKDQSPSSLGSQQAGEPLEVGLEHCSSDSFVFMLSI